jgi:hypothetical protein
MQPGLRWTARVWCHPAQVNLPMMNMRLSGQSLL